MRLLRTYLEEDRQDGGSRDELDVYRKTPIWHRVGLDRQIWVLRRHTMLMMMTYISGSGMQVLQYRYCNNSGSLTPLPCRVLNHCLVVQVLVRTEG